MTHGILHISAYVQFQDQNNEWKMTGLLEKP